MDFRELAVDGCYEITLEPREDDRGWFARAFCASEFAGHGLDPVISQINTSLSRKPGTLRGMHYQGGASSETKVVRALRGAVFDAVIDLRSQSPTFMKWTSIELTGDRRNAIYVPKGCAHGVLTLAPDTELLYSVSAPYDPSAEGGVRWDDPAFGIEWPRQPSEISEKDLSWPDWRSLPKA